MNTNKIKSFMKKYGYYVAVGAISVGAIVAVFLTPPKSDFTQDDSQAYLPSEEITEIALEEPIFEVGELEESFFIEQIEESPNFTDKSESVVGEVALEEESYYEEALQEDLEGLVAETFSSTTVEEETEVFFAEGDTLAWPIKGSIVVPYKDETTSHWYSETLNQTMRTFGICISGQAGDSVVAAAKGVVEEIVSDATSVASLINVGNVGEVMIIDHGNGYKTLYGFQQGTINKDLMGQTVSVGQEIGQLGQGSGPFVSVGDNVYFQVLHNGQIMNPEALLAYQEASVQASVDMGHAPDSAN
jgi:murein DD-endopeptidase MepM/ murein hydrolase activator NlpD